MDNTRKVTGVDSVHQGIDLETPFKGANVLVAVIDQGFEYKHIAFSDAEGKTRVKQLWNRTNYYSNPNGTVRQKPFLQAATEWRRMVTQLT